MSLVTPKAEAKHELLLNKPASVLNVTLYISSLRKVMPMEESKRVIYNENHRTLDSRLLQKFKKAQS